VQSGFEFWNNSCGLGVEFFGYWSPFKSLTYIATEPDSVLG